MLKGSSPIRESSEVTGGLIGSQSPVRYDKLASPSQREREEPAAGAKWWKAKVIGALALVVVVVVVVTVVVVVPKHGRSTKAAPVVGGEASQPPLAPPAVNMIIEACNTTTYPDSCRTSLSAYPGASTASVKDLVLIGFEIANRDVASGWEAALEFLRGQQSGSQLLLGALDDCKEVMGNCLDELNTSISTFQNLSAIKEVLDGQINDIQTSMAAALTEIDTCSESLADTDQTACDRFNVMSTSFKQELSTALGLVNYWSNSLESTSGHNRRLLSLSRSGIFSIIGSQSSKEAVRVQPVLQTDQKADLAVPGSRSAVRCVLNCFRADPVCGEDGVTYWCGTADAECAGVGVAHAGFCNIENGGAGGKGSRAVQSLLLVHLVWLFLAGLLVLIELP